jgi:hypothetical protein
VFGDSVKLKRGEQSSWPSAIYDGRSIRLRGVRGETLGVQVLLSRDGLCPVELVFDEPSVRVESYAAHYVEVREPSSSMYGPSRGRGWYPDVLVPVGGAVDGADAAFFDVVVSPEAEPGVYAGHLTVAGERIDASVRVEPLNIDVRSTPRVWVYYEPREIARAHGLAGGGPEQLELERRYAELFRAHGAYLATDLDRDGFARRKHLIADARYWPVWIDTSSPAKLAADVELWVEEFRDLAAVPFTIPVDEPRRLAQRLRVRNIGRVVDSVAAGGDRFLLAVTDGAHPLYRNAVDVLISPDAFPSPPASTSEAAPRRWTYNGRPPQAGSMIIDTDGVALRTWGWIGYRHDVELWYAWEGLYFSDRYNGGGRTDLVRDPLTFDQRPAGGQDYGNGDGLLVYPGPLPSLRLKALRRGQQDRKLLEMLAACGGVAEARDLARRMVPVALGEAAGGPPSWPIDEQDWEKGRAEVVDAALRRCGDVL